jgi:hypothetical protein
MTHEKETKLGRPLLGGERLYPHSICLSDKLIVKLEKKDGRPLSIIARELLDQYANSK